MQDASEGVSEAQIADSGIVIFCRPSTSLSRTARTTGKQNSPNDDDECNCGRY